MYNQDKPAFPYVKTVEKDTLSQETAQGLTKREYLAALAMQGILSSHFDNTLTPETVADYATHCADGLLDALNKY